VNLPIQLLAVDKIIFNFLHSTIQGAGSAREG